MNSKSLPEETPLQPFDIEEGFHKLTQGLNQVSDAIEETEQRGIVVSNNARGFLGECEDRVREIDRHIIAEEELVDRALRGIADLQGLVDQHQGNLTGLRAEKQARLDAAHTLRTMNITA